MNFSRVPFQGQFSENFSPVKTVRILLYALVPSVILLMALGGMTRVMNAGLSCPDWPLCFGTLFPEMNLQVFLEWFHRVVATAIGAVTLFLFGFSWWTRKQLPKGVPFWTGLALGTVLFQGVLGGLTVTESLRFDIVTAHLGTATLFLLILVGLAAALTPFQATGKKGPLLVLSVIAAVCGYIQVILGGLVASQWALQSCMGDGILCQIMNNHLYGVVPTTLMVLVIGVTAWRMKTYHPQIRRLSLSAVGLLILQIVWGVTAFKIQLTAPLITVAHLITGVTLVATLVALVVFTWRERHLLSA
ncbi:MAG: COX15/CtaA family protein [Gloeobacterales cyanobacterium]